MGLYKYYKASFNDAKWRIEYFRRKKALAFRLLQLHQLPVSRWSVKKIMFRTECVDIIVTYVYKVNISSPHNLLLIIVTAQTLEQLEQ